MYKRNCVLHLAMQKTFINISTITCKVPCSAALIVFLDFLQPDKTYYVIDMVCWRGYSLYDCTSEFRFFWLNSKLSEMGASDPPSQYHWYRFNIVPIYECNLTGLQAAYSGSVQYVKDGLLFYNKWDALLPLFISLSLCLSPPTNYTVEITAGSLVLRFWSWQGCVFWQHSTHYLELESLEL